MKNNEIIQTASGATVKVPVSWRVVQKNSTLQLDGPEQDLTIYLEEAIVSGQSIQKIAKVAWEKLRPEFNFSVQMEVPVSRPGGWEKAIQVIYDVPVSEGRIVAAIVSLYRGWAYCVLLDGTTAGFSRRSSDFQSLYESWKPVDFAEINLNQVSAKTWSGADIQEFEKFISDSMKLFQVPGLAIALVSQHNQNNAKQIFYSKGFGVKQLDSMDPVDTNTPFMIGSITKSQTTLMMAKLVEKGIISWETRISKILPEFRLGDSDLTEQLTIRHTVSASTGMPRRDLDWIFKYRGISPEARLEQMKEMKPTTRVGETFQYSNILFMAGGYAAAKAYTASLGLTHLSLEESYQRAMEELVFRPLQMSKTVLKIKDAEMLGAARPHAMEISGKMVPIGMELEETCYSVAPAGAIWSTVEDLSKYILLEITKGSVDGQVVIDELPLLERRVPGIKIGENSSYGLGLMVSQEQGITVIHHGGGTIGFASDFLLLPDHGLGLVILSNSSGFSHSLIAAIRQKFKEITFGSEIHSEEQIQFALQGMQAVFQHNREHIYIDAEHTSELDALLGDYVNPHLGEGKLRKVDDSYEFDFGEWKSKLGISVDSGGERSVVLTQPPLSGAKFLILKAEQGGERLLLDGGQDKHEFLRVGKL